VPGCCWWHKRVRITAEIPLALCVRAAAPVAVITASWRAVPKPVGYNRFSFWLPQVLFEPGHRQCVLKVQHCKAINVYDKTCPANKQRMGLFSKKVDLLC